MDISVIIPAHNEEAYLGACLESILENQTENVKEVIVVDNASTDATADVAARYGVRVVEEKKKGLTKARQAGLDAAKGPLLAYVDADTCVPSHWFHHINAEFLRNPKMVALSGPYRYIGLPKKWQQQANGIFWRCVAFPTYLCTKFMIVGGNFVVKKSAVETIGGFDQDIAFYGEDTNIARRLHKIGKVKFHIPFYAHTSARRLQNDGMIKTMSVYAANYLSEATIKRAITKKYKDHR